MGYNMGLQVIKDTDSTIAGGATFTSEAFDIHKSSNFGLFIESVAGTDPSFTIKYTASLDYATYISPENDYLLDAATEATALGVRLVPARMVKFLITNNSANALTISVKFVKQEAF